MNKSFFLIVSFFISFSVFSQGEFQFEKESHDFGKVLEGEKPSVDFTFKNIGNAPIILSNVKPSCGCTTPNWPKEPILPGKSAVIKVSYNSKGRIGIFNKSITISSNAKQATKVIRIKGVVEKATPEEIYTPEQLANSPIIKLNKQEHFFGKVEKNKNQEYKFTITNEGKESLMLTNIRSACNCVKYKLDKPMVEAGKSAVLTITYTPRSLGDVNDVAFIYSNDLRTPNYRLNLKAKVVNSLSGGSLLGGQGVGF